MNSTTPEFDPENSKYRCFFGILHVTTATKCVIFYELICALIFFGCFLYKEGIHEASILACSIAGFIEYFVIISSIFALKKEKPKLLFPYLIASTLGIIFEAYIIGYNLIYKNYEDAWILLQLAEFVVHIWFVLIVCKCYQYLNDKKINDCLPMFFSNKNATLKFVGEDHL